jgi:hypothetical protein
MAAAVGKGITGASLPTEITGFGVVTKLDAEYFGAHAKAHNAAGEVSATDAAHESGVRITVALEVDNYTNLPKPNDTFAATVPPDASQTFLVESCKPTSDITGEEVDTAEIVAVAYYTTAP